MFENTKKFITSEKQKITSVFKKIGVLTRLVGLSVGVTGVYNTGLNNQISNSIDTVYNLTQNPEVAAKIIDEIYKNGSFIDKTIYVTSEAFNNIIYSQVFHKPFSNDEYIKDTLTKKDNEHKQKLRLNPKIQQLTQEEIEERSLASLNKNDTKYLESITADNAKKIIELRNKIISPEELAKDNASNIYYYNANLPALTKEQFKQTIEKKNGVSSNVEQKNNMKNNLERRKSFSQSFSMIINN